MRRARLARWMALALASGAAAAAADRPPAPGDRLSFVACPIVRDTRSVPCWLAQYRDQLYFLTIQTDVSAPVTPPWLGHRVLVEGIVADEPGICGGKVLKPVTLSVLPELDAACNTVLPAEDRYDLTFEPPRPPGPSRGRLAFGDPAARAGTPAAGASSTVTPAAPAIVPAADATFTLQYEFDGKVAFRHAQTLQRILDTARDLHAPEIQVTGYRSASRLSTGEVLRERADIGRERAEQIRELLRGAGLDGIRYAVSWKDLAKRPDGIADATNRRVDVLVRRAQ